MIKHIHDLDVFENKPKRNSFFLVPKVPLVSQQARYLRSTLNLKVKHYYGDMDVDRWDLDKWSNEFSQTQVMVMTPDIFRFLLDKAFLKMDMVLTKCD